MKAPAILRYLIHHGAAAATLTRAAIVGVNFGTMMGLAAWLGIAAYGVLIVSWGLAMICAAVVGCGGPLLLLRVLSDGGGATVGALIRVVLMYPCIIAGLCLSIFPLHFPTLQWLSILALACAINLTACIASVMRALGSVHWSMALRDAAPFAALGWATCLREDAILITAALVLCLICGVAVAWIWRHPGRCELIGQSRTKAPMPWDMWGTSVLGMGLAQVDIVVGGGFLSNEQIGLYALVKRITNLVALPVSVSTWVTSVSVGAAYGAGDREALAMASRKGSAAAFVPGAGIALLCLLALIGHQITGLSLWGVDADPIVLALLVGAIVQVCFAATFTVATLCDMAHLAALSRLGSICVYLALLLATPVLNPLINAVIYIIAISMGSIGLWAVVRNRLQIDTAATALLTMKMGSAWKPS